MADEIETGAPQSVPEGESVPTPETATPEAGAGTETETAEGTENEAEPEPDDSEKARRAALDRRFAKLTKDKHDALREAERMKAELALYRAQQSQEGTQATAEQLARQPGSEQLTQAQIDARAREIVQQQTFRQAVESTIEAGTKEFADFNDKCNLLADFGANDVPYFLPIITDTPNGHKVLQYLGSNAHEAERILNLPERKMAVEIDRIAAKVGKPTPVAVSKAPPPVSPIDGTARATVSPDKMNDEEFDKWYAAQRAKKRA